MNLSRVYLHYPFCTKLCHYCNFAAGVSTTDNFTNQYYTALLKEITHYKTKFDFSQITSRSLYFGGGTPSLISLDQLENIFSHFTLTPETEVTLEINPETVTYEKAKIWYQLGINRVSLGWQTMNADTLKSLGRTSTPQNNIKAFEILRNVGFDNISVDRILSIHNDTDKEFFDAIELYKPDHISTYQLSIEDKTVLSLWTKQKKYLPLLDEEAIQIESITDDLLENLGFSRYETSNYAQLGKEGQHNMGYWNYDYWLGLGSGAAGFLPDNGHGFHYRNHFKFRDYCDDPIAYEESEHINLYTAIKDALMLGIRKKSGIDKVKLSQRLGVAWENIFTDTPNPEYFINTASFLILKKEMIPLSNPAILSLWNIIHPDILNK